MGREFEYKQLERWIPRHLSSICQYPERVSSESVQEGHDDQLYFSLMLVNTYSLHPSLFVNDRKRGWRGFEYELKVEHITNLFNSRTEDGVGVSDFPNT